MDGLRSDIRRMLDDLGTQWAAAKRALEVDQAGKSIAVDIRVGLLSAAAFEREFGGPVRIY